MATTQERIEDPVEAPLAERTEQYRSLRSDVWRQFRRHKGALVGLVLLAIIIFASFLGPVIWQGDGVSPDTVNANQSPSLEHPMGTDNLGRDVMARVLVGGRISLAVGVTAMIVGIFLGTTIGVLSGFFRKLDGPLMRITDLFLALPILPLLLVVMMLFREPLTDAFGLEGGIFILVVGIIGATSWMTTSRVVRGQVLTVKEKEYVLAANSIGTRKRNVVMRHILPNVLSPVMVAAALGVAAAIITESALSFLGLGFPPSFPTWGRLLFDSKDYLPINPWRVIWPGVMISLTVISVNFIGDGIRDALDPKLRSR
jgi:peptide/nickel transport system permease protein